MVQTAAVFSDHMVLQRDKAIAVFGKGNPGEIVRVSIPERQVSVTAVVRPDGTWQASLPPQKGGIGCTMIVNDTIFSDVAIGEVWLAGGQSNMEFSLEQAEGGQEELKHCKDSGVRYFAVPRNTFPDDTYPAAWADARWQLPDLETCRSWSAVAYLAARELVRKLGVPVGILGCNYGGSSISCWLPEEDLQAHQAGRGYLETYQNAVRGKTDAEMIQEYDAYVEYHQGWEARAAACYQENSQMPWEEVLRRCGENRWPGPLGIKSPYRPAGMYHMMLEPIVPYTLRGVFYYQGEEDVPYGAGYATLLTVLIARWRKLFESDTMPFLLVQLPMFAYEDAPEDGSWSVLREAQMEVYRTVKHTGIAVTLDCGERNNIHPGNKHPVGHRLALQARHLVYGEGDLEAFGPIYRSCVVSGKEMTIWFSHADQGMEWHGEPVGFELAGADGIYYPARAVLEGSAVRLTSDQVSAPRAARYNWVNYGAVSLFGRNGIPAAPFRTEDIGMPLT